VIARRRGGGPLIVELLGPGGAGKSTVLAQLHRSDPAIRVDLGVWTLPRPLLALGAAERAPTLLQLFRAAGAPPWDEAKYVIKLRALEHQVRLERRSRHSAIVFDEGPVFALSWLRADAHHSATNGGLRAWWPGALATWAAAVDLVAYIDAPNPVLAQRIRTRAHSHPLKHSADADLFAFLDRYRAAYGRVLDDLAALSGPAVLSYRSDRQGTAEIAERLLTALGTPHHDA
jgi:hypothetical protein